MILREIHSLNRVHHLSSTTRIKAKRLKLLMSVKETIKDQLNELKNNLNIESTNVRHYNQNLEARLKKKISLLLTLKMR